MFWDEQQQLLTKSRLLKLDSEEMELEMREAPNMADENPIVSMFVTMVVVTVVVVTVVVVILVVVGYV